MSDAEDKLKLARKHLERVLAAWGAPTDWDDLSLYGFYCLEAAVGAAAAHFGLAISTRHWQKAETAAGLHANHGLPDISHLLHELNDARKAAAYGDVEAPELDAESVASQIEAYVNAVAALLAGGH
ncbi:MAG TPA: hypothetical protein VE959_32040 [Bryobacteraceae bacterium]|nr:hypothetical protein SBA4_1770010 [Candidatus Sulfopaludibacter sp. SbA4]HYW47544.1 hypothetical protein [Bryobacteraceae bacterium]